MDHRGWGQDGRHRTRVTLGERVCGVLQCPAEGRTAGWRALLHTPGGQSCDRKLATPLQHRPPAWVSGLQASGSGGVCARLHGLAGCAIPTGFAGQGPRSTPTNHALTFTSDHPMEADQALDTDKIDDAVLTLGAIVTLIGVALVAARGDFTAL